jgi:hypothetical protein
MALMDILGRAQGGHYFAGVGNVVGLGAKEAEKAISAMAPAIAQKLKTRAAADPDAFDNLLDLLEDEGGTSDLDDAEAMTGPEAVSDGNAILDDVYGNRNAAISTMRELAPAVPETSLSKLAAISATSVLAALAQSQAMPAAAEPPSSGGGGLLGTIVSAIVQGAARQLAPRRKRTPRPSIEDIFGSILGTRR